MLAGGENPGPDRPEITGPKRLVDDFRVFRATEGSTETSLGVWSRNGAVAHGG